VGRNQRDSLGDFGAFNTEVTEMLRALRVEALIATKYTRPLLGDDTLIQYPRVKNLSALRRNVTFSSSEGR